MAVRLINIHRQPLRVDLRGGEVLVLGPGQRSDVLLEELLYDNCHLVDWERAGWIRRMPARLADTDEEAAGTEEAHAGSAKTSASTKKKAAPANAAKEGAGEE